MIDATIVININNVNDMLRKRGLEPNGRIQQMFTTTCAREMDPYVPMQSGILKNTRAITADSITYTMPYARNMYYGIVMVDPATGAAGFLTAEGWRSRKGIRKVASGREYNYHGAPKRGKLWDRRMWVDKNHKIINDIARAAGGKAE